jgi:hypothetical protein
MEGGFTGCGKMQAAEEERPPGLKPPLISRAYAVLKGRSSTVMHTFLSFSAACSAAEGDCGSHHEFFSNLQRERMSKRNRS